jgi:hypothetical protein
LKNKTASERARIWIWEALSVANYKVLHGTTVKVQHGGRKMKTAAISAA